MLRHIDSICIIIVLRCVGISQLRVSRATLYMSLTSDRLYFMGWSRDTLQVSDQ